MVRAEVRESEIEDIFAQYPMLMRGVLELSHDVFLVARQKILPSGRLDLVYSHSSELILVELKVEPFRESFVRQVLDYKNDLDSLQSDGEFIQGTVNAVLLCSNVTTEQKMLADNDGVKAVSYDPGEVLVAFYRNAPLDARYLDVKPADHGVWRIGIINESLYLLKRHSTVGEVALERGLSSGTVGNQIRFAVELGLVERRGRHIHLSSRGEEYIEARDPLIPPNMLSADQATIIRKFILANPFHSGVTFGILTMASSIFELSKNTYPIPLEIVSSHFISSAGLRYRWDSDKAIDKGVRMYTNYAIDLGLVGKIGDKYFVTPSGLNFVLLLNMHKSLKLVESVTRLE